MRFKFIQNIINTYIKIGSHILQESYKKKLEIDYYKENIRTLILGSSHGAYGYRAMETEFNFCLASQDLYYSYKLYELYAKNLPNLKNIILFYSVFSNGFLLDKTSEKERAIAYKKLFNIPILNNCFFLKFKSLFFNMSLKKFKKAPITYNNGNEINYVFMNIPLNERIKQHYKNNQRENKQNHWIKKLSDLAKENNHNLYIVLSPAKTAYKECLPNSKELFKDLLNLVESINVTLIDLYDSNLFIDDDFGDYDHLTQKGAEKLSNYVREKIIT